MTRRRDKAFGLLVVLMVLAALAAAIALLAAQSGTILSQTQRMQSQADMQDLQASAIAWAKRHKGGPLPAGRPTTLDANHLGIVAAELSVEAADPNQIRVSCRHELRGHKIDTSSLYAAPGR